MRIQQLQLLRYGKFTDRVLTFPHAHRDFHLIVGPNEAGKSTARSAILDLLYGIETRSTFDFLHAKADMRLGATLHHQGAALDFVRIKARAKTLLGADGGVLPELALVPFLAGTDRAFFDQMFGLDHGRLEAGGNAILGASNDIGQILFQSAAGIASLGAVRDQLEAEADKLWARRRSSDRAYYIASDELGRADAALKAATVRTKDWMEARDRVQALEDRRGAAGQRHRDLEVERLRLERVRRVAPPLRQWRDHQAALEPLAGAVLLPPEAARQLAETELELAAAGRDQQLFASQSRLLRERLAEIHLDERLLKHEADIQALAERRQQVRNHERDIDRRRMEIASHWQQVEALVRQLGWPEGTEETLTAKLPALPPRATLADLAKRFPVLEQAQQTAGAAVAEKVAAHQMLVGQLEGLSVKSVPPSLRVALAAARALGDIKASLARDQALTAKCERDLASAITGLGRGAPDLTTLRQLLPPSLPDIARRQKKHAQAQAASKALADQRAELDTSIRARQLEITQYRNAHHPVSLVELAEARGGRDALWHAIKAGEQPVHVVAVEFELKLATADRVSDQRHDKAQEVSELQARIDALARLQQQATDNAARLTAQGIEVAAIDAAWSEATQALGLTGLPLHDFELWLAARDKVLRAQDALTEARQAMVAAQHSAAAASASLAAALGEAGIAVDSEAALATLLLIASDAVDSAAATKARLDELTKQRELAASALARQQEKSATAQLGFDAWSAAWSGATEAVGLTGSIGVAPVEGALTVMAEIDGKLREVREIRQSRIEVMQRDLHDFEQEVARVLDAAAPELPAMSASAAVTELASQLGKAQGDKKEMDRLKQELDGCEAQAKSANDRVARAEASVLPLMGLARANSRDELRLSIELSDRRRSIESAAGVAHQAVADGSDGLPLPSLEAEIANTEATQVPVLMADINRQLEGVRHEQDALTAELTQASAQLAQIAGQDDAARAESERQDALAKMANAAERYVKVYTASRLLKWAIDRYRETRQGPMLKHAGDVFCALTLGSFQKLTVDFDSEPLTLHGQRPDGALVGIAELSAGTRDQLYLALRLAALQLHLEQGHALPFIADDLFINYDDRRAKAGLEALAKLSEKTQVIFLSHHDHLIPSAKEVFGSDASVAWL